MAAVYRLPVLAIMIVSIRVAQTIATVDRIIETGLPTTDKIIEDGLALTDKITELGIV